MNSQRDLRIDFFRGLALLIVVVDHIEGWSRNSLLESWTLISLGFSDAAEIFVFLSGYVFAVAYSKAIDQGGLASCMKKAVTRSLQIYAAYLLAAWVVIAVGSLSTESVRPYGDGLRIGDRAWESVLQSVILRFQPYGFGILAFYVLVLPGMPVMLHLCRCAPALAWLISGAAYLVAQFYPEVNLSRFADGQGWYFNPLAWQFLFFVGVFLGTKPTPISLIPRALPIVLCIAILAIGVFVVKIVPYLTRSSPHVADSLQPLLSLRSAWAAKSTLGPLRLVHFFALAYLVSKLVPPSLPSWSRCIANPIVISGQQSLELYAFGLVFAFVVAIVVARGQDPGLTVLMLDLDGCLASILFAYWVNRRKRSEASQADV